MERQAPVRIRIDGVGTFDVDRSFADLSPEQQGREFNGIIAQVRYQQPSGDIATGNVDDYGRPIPRLRRSEVT